MSTDCKLRTVVESTQYSEQRDQIQPDTVRFDEMMNALVWAVAQSPEECEHVLGTFIHVIKLRNKRGEPFIRVALTFDNDSVLLRGIGYVIAL